jgi:hypothetical protein
MRAFLLHEDMVEGVTGWVSVKAQLLRSSLPWHLHLHSNRSHFNITSADVNNDSAISTCIWKDGHTMTVTPKKIVVTSSQSWSLIPCPGPVSILTLLAWPSDSSGLREALGRHCSTWSTQLLGSQHPRVSCDARDSWEHRLVSNRSFYEESGQSNIYPHAHQPLPPKWLHSATQRQDTLFSLIWAPLRI